jgi:hypothetical protein
VAACRDAGLRVPHAFPLPAADEAFGNRLERLQEFNEIGFLSPGEIQLELPVIVIDHRAEIGRTSIVKIWRMLPEAS